MRVYLQNDILFINQEDLPHYKKGGSVVRNSYFWALKSIACYTARGSDWEFDAEVWVALSRMLLCFTESGYLGYQETILEFPQDLQIPEVLRSVSTWL
ncbi:MAG: hypothetical protein DSM107014_16275 [Gomphosphaeria aponina SAG 52.96 = DSM 107014]|uniref:Uncharacterized protein n=1 Tax=Gomphosphaeria aponina SAG 52.96 = DSM 107014 TaxID=1521640 RepID=A0A941GU42_9CHRO|nr:hypothetical protein [Gomphosphaeria aponina SAG 52.96 = DSM 107014]